jgi:hypothetical protein
VSVDEILDEGAVRLEAAIRGALLLSGTDEVWAAGLEVERIRSEVEAATGVSLCDPAPQRVVNACVDGAGRRTVEQAQQMLEARS